MQFRRGRSSSTTKLPQKVGAESNMKFCQDVPPYRKAHWMKAWIVLRKRKLPQFSPISDSATYVCCVLKLFKIRPSFQNSQADWRKQSVVATPFVCNAQILQNIADGLNIRRQFCRPGTTLCETRSAVRGP